MLISDKLRFLKKFGFSNIKQIGGIKKTTELFNSLHEMYKNGGMLLCKDCALRKISETCPDAEQGLKKSVDDGVYKPSEKGKNCFLCSKDAEYVIPMNMAMEGIKKASTGGEQ